MQPGVRRHQGRDRRGLSLSTFVAVVLVCLFLMAGLVIDGGAQVSAERRAQVVAAQAARAGADAAAAQRLAGGSGVPAAIAAANTVLSSQGVSGEVQVSAGVLTVTTSVTTPTVFLSLLGQSAVIGHGRASAVLIRS